MALIGTISGSVGSGGSLVSATAISGTLVIADAPPASFPSLPVGAKFFVSGTKGVDVDFASSVFGGDVFMSGALGLEEYLQLRVLNNKRFPTATTASYIYTSGSTNDLYFTQFSGSLRNDVRLRWLEGTLTTGLLNGGVLSTVNGTTTFSVTAGSGLIIAQNASIVSDPYPTTTYVSWPAFVSASLVYSGTAQITYIAVDAAGALSQLSTTPTLAQFKDRVVLGRILHQTGSVSNGAINSPAMSYAVTANTFDFIRPFGPLKVSGHVLAASGSTLGLTKTAGDSYSEGRNYAFDPSAPNTILAADDPALVDCKIYRQYVSSSTTIIDTGIANAGYTVIDRAQYNNGGTLAAVGNSEWTNQRVYWFPKSVNRALFVYYGTKKYGTLLEAVAGLLTENFVEGDNTKGAAIYVGAVSVKGNESSLANATATITQGGLFRSAGGGGGGSTGTTPPGGLTTQVQFNDAGAFAGDAGLTYNSLTDSLTVAGDITGSNLRLTGDIAVLGGDLVTNSGGLRVWGSSQPVTGSDVFLYISGSTAGTSDVVVFGGNVINSGSITVKNASGTSVVGISTGGAISGSSNLRVGGNITGSNLFLAGDIAVEGGNITSTAATFNFVTGATTTLNIGTTATAITLGSPGGRTTVAHDLAVGTGNIIGAPGAGANVMTLLSSGNIIAKLDVDNSAAGHKFIVQDYTGASQFFVGENGNAELTGSLTVTGSIKAFSGLSGSLTKLTDGTDYLIAGSNITLTTGSSGAVTVANTSIPTLGAVYGGGAHGAFDLDGINTYASQFTKVGSIYTQIADVRATTFRVRSGSIAQPSQFWIYAESAFRNDGTIRNNGNSGSLGVAGATVAAAGTLQCQGIAGAVGRTTTANGFAVTGLQVIGGAGGTGGAGGASTGGTSTATPPPATSQAVGTSFFRTTHRRLDVITVGTVTAGIGGGSGGATLNSGTATSGASGGGGSAIRINARSFQNDGTITCDGGAGGNATTAPDAVAGGGGGGGGGFIGIMCDTLVSLGTVTCTGGLGGLGSGGGTAGGMGLSGSISVMTPTGTTNL